MSSHLIQAPQGVFEPYYDTALTPEDIRFELQSRASDDQELTRLRERLYNYRFFEQKDGRHTMICDRFMMFWVELSFCDRTVGSAGWQLRAAHKRLEKMLVNDKLKTVFYGRWPDERILYEQLYNSARRFISVCQYDSAYTSYVFGIVRMNRSQVLGKLLGEFVDASVCFTYRCGLLASYPVIGQAALHAWDAELPNMQDRVWERIAMKAGENATADIVSILAPPQNEKEG